MMFLLAALGLSTASAGEPFAVGGFIFKSGEKWTAQQPTSSMRKAELVFDAEGDEDPVAVFFEFGKSGVEANIDRWKGQFEGGPTDEKREELGEGHAFVELSGVYLDGPPFGGNKTPREGYKMLGAVLTGEETAVFIKLTAPAAIADEAKESMLEWIKAAITK